MSNTKREWPHSIGKEADFDEEYQDRVRRGHTSLPVRQFRADGTPYPWAELWGEGKKISKRFRIRGERRRNRVIDIE